MKRWRGISGATIGAAAAAALAATVAQAGERPCGPARELAGALRGGYGELPVSTGLQPDGQLLQIFASPRTGTWTAVTTSPRGVSCVLATGRRWSERGIGPLGGGGGGPPVSLTR